MIQFLLVLPLFTTVYAQRCCPYPGQWEATERIISGSRDDEGHTAVTTGKVNISVDGSNQRVATNNSFTTGNTTQTFSTLLLYEQGTMYIIEGNTCVHDKLGKWEPPFCLPDNVSFISQYHLGPRYDVRVAEFSYSIPGALTINMGVTLSACTPVVRKVYGRIHNQNTMSITTFNGLTFGIKDTHVFDVPVICQKNLSDNSFTCPSAAVSLERNKVEDVIISVSGFSFCRDTIKMPAGRKLSYLNDILLDPFLFV